MTKRVCALALLVACSSTPGARVPIVIGSAAVAVDTRTQTTRTGEAAVGDWIMDLLVEESNKLGKQVDVGLMNAGAIRGGLIDPKTFKFLTDDGKLGKIYPAGPLTDVDVEGWYPFHDDYTFETLTGTQLKSVLERGVSELPPDLRNDLGGPFIQVSGVRYTADCSGAVQQLNSAMNAISSEGSRIVKLQVGAKVIYDAANGIDLLASSTVRVAVNSFIVKGLDGHISLGGGTNVDTITYAELGFGQKMKDKVKATSPIAMMTDGRIVIVGDCNQPLTFP
jgi:2',3'-cyclic-nucleotide 2'-phosphodiesterase (5'-nucleotidase family)